MWQTDYDNIELRYLHQEIFIRLGIFYLLQIRDVSREDIYYSVDSLRPLYRIIKGDRYSASPFDQISDWLQPNRMFQSVPDRMLRFWM